MKFLFNSIDEKLNFLEDLHAEKSLNDELWDAAIELSNDKNSEVRLYVAEALSNSYGEQSEFLLMKLLDDEDYLVRCEACISLQNRNSEIVLNSLLEKRNDSNYMVRGYALMSAANIVVRMSEKHRERLKVLLLEMFSDSSEWVIIAVLYSLVLIGYHDYEFEMFEHLGSRDYRNRSFVLSLLDELMDREVIKNLDKLSGCLFDCILREDNKSVYEKLNKLYLRIA